MTNLTFPHLSFHYLKTILFDIFGLNTTISPLPIVALSFPQSSHKFAIAQRAFVTYEFPRLSSFFNVLLLLLCLCYEHLAVPSPLT